MPRRHENHQPRLQPSSHILQKPLQARAHVFVHPLGHIALTLRAFDLNQLTRLVDLLALEALREVEKFASSKLTTRDLTLYRPGDVFRLLGRTLLRRPELVILALTLSFASGLFLDHGLILGLGLTLRSTVQIRCARIARALFYPTRFAHTVIDHRIALMLLEMILRPSSVTAITDHSRRRIKRTRSSMLRGRFASFFVFPGLNSSPGRVDRSVRRDEDLLVRGANLPIRVWISWLRLLSRCFEPDVHRDFIGKMPPFTGCSLRTSHLLLSDLSPWLFQPAIGLS